MKSSAFMNPDPSGAAVPNADGIFQAELSESSHRPGRNPLPRGVLFLLLVIGVAVPIVLYWLPAERATWQIAAAQAKWLDDDLPGAISILEIAAEEFPDTPAVYEQRLQFYFEAKQFDNALADAEKLVALTPKSPSALGLKSQALHHLGKHDKAIEVCKEILRLAQEEWIGSAAQALNSLAYAQAIGDTQLEEALKNINESLRLAGDNPALLDTRGYVKYRLGDSKAAKEDIERAVEHWEQLVAYQEAQSLPSVRSYQSETDRASYQQALAVMLYHRALVYDRLKMHDQAKVDRERVRNLGYEPNDQLF
ncbi:MAG TPA: hypothetical protein P5307_19785 [Pirellulaceae bacterium]|nr:hypothetical protein [Pirellulaceae bacterium]